MNSEGRIQKPESHESIPASLPNFIRDFLSDSWILNFPRPVQGGRVIPNAPKGSSAFQQRMTETAR